MTQEFEHIPVLPKEVIEALRPQSDKTYVDGTLGGGGHSLLILQATNGQVKIIGIDQDPIALQVAGQRLAPYKDKVTLIKSNFRKLKQVLNQLQNPKVDGILLDLGVSTYQLETPERGFSFNDSKEAKIIPLDMRMDPSSAVTATSILNHCGQLELTQIFRQYGAEAQAEKVAARIVATRKSRPISTTNELLAIIKSALPPKYRFSRTGHYASPFFRAIRVKVNDEVGALKDVLPQGVESLNPGGRMAVISFDSFEDAIVKHTFRKMAQTPGPNGKPIITLITKHPIIAAPEELATNPKAGSAKLRVIEKR